MYRLETEAVEQQWNKEQVDRLAGDSTLRQVEGLGGDRACSPDIEYVEVNRLPETPDVHGPQDFKGNTPQERRANYESLKRDMLRHEEMRPYIEQGYGPDTWDQWDQQAGIGHAGPGAYERGYQDVYHAYYHRSDAVAVSETNGDFTGILNGEHRVFLARELGIQKLPVHMQHG